MGISVQTSGIKVERGKFYLVNLNADPSLNELLVYYLKEDKTIVGREGGDIEPDIQLCGLGIAAHHADLEIVDGEVFVTPQKDARTCVNGREIREKMKIKHGDRIVWGMNHYFRVNCPTAQNSPANPVDYEFAQRELLSEGSDPIREAIDALQRQHRDDKEEALARQRAMYEKQMRMLKSQLMSPSTPSFTPYFGNMTPITPTGGALRGRYQQLMEEREAELKQALVRLKEDVLKANSLAREANVLAKELGKSVEFGVTLQIPAANLTPHRRRGAFVTEPAIVVRRATREQNICSLEEFEHKVISMRELYELRQLEIESSSGGADPFYEAQENHNLIGVANVFLEVLFHDVTLEYQVPIISQQGDVAGRLNVTISRTAGSLEGNLEGERVRCRIGIKEARGLPPALSHFVFCQYNFWNEQEPNVVPPLVDEQDCNRFRFDHAEEYEVEINDEFLEHVSEGALSIEVWGHRLLFY